MPLHYTIRVRPSDQERHESIWRKAHTYIILLPTGYVTLTQTATYLHTQAPDLSGFDPIPYWQVEEGAKQALLRLITHPPQQGSLL